MALQKQKVFVNLGQGLDTKTDEKLVQIGKLLVLENGIFQKNGRIDKRPGATLLASQTIAAESLTGASSLATFNSEILQYNKQKLYSLSTGANKWVDKGSCVSASMNSTQVVRNTASQTQADYASNNGVAVYAYEDSRGGVRATVYDEVTMTPMLSDVSLDSSASRAKCLSFKNYLYVFYYKTGNLYVRRLNPQLPTAFDTAISLTTDVNTTSPTYDVLAYNALKVMVVFNKQSAGEIKIGSMNDEGTFVSLDDITGAATSCLSIVKGNSLDRFFILWANTSDGVKCAITNNGGTEIVTPFTVENYTATEVVNITGVANRAATGINVFYHVLIASQTYNHYVKTNSITNAGAVGTPSIFMRSVGLWSKAFSFYFDSETTDHYYVGLSYSSSLQNSYFIVRNDGFIVSKMQYSLGAGLPTRRLLASVTAETSTNFSFAILNKTKLVSEDNNVFSLQGVSKTTINFDSDEEFNGVQLGNNLHIVGGILSMYDGQSVVEHGFHLFPETLSISQSGAAGLADGIYNYTALYEWTDNFGQVHRSAPSVPVQFEVTGGPRNVAVIIPTLRLTEKKAASNRTEVSVALYRTEKNGGEIYYRVSSVTSPTYNSTTADTVTITDTTTDADLISREILYATGGVLENISPPSCKYIRTFKDRIFLSGLENKDEAWYSKIHSSGLAVEFSNFLVQNVASEGGGISGIFDLNDKFIYFKPDRFFITYGDGPNNTGEGQEFAKPELVTSDAGCDNNNSIVRVPNGIMFKSRKGFYALNSSLQLSYIGKDVESFNDRTVTSAVLKSDDNQVRFTTSEGPTIVYDYLDGQWSTFTPQKFLDTVIWNDSYVYVDSLGNVYQEDKTIFRDAGRAINLNLVTGWIALDSIGGFQRLYRISFIGEYKSQHKIRLSIGYDFSPDFSENHIFDSDDALEISTYGDTDTYGSESPYGGANSSLRFVVKPKVQKCQAFRVKIEDLTQASSSGSGEGFNITGIILLVGIKGQVGKFRLQQQIARS